MLSLVTVKHFGIYYYIILLFQLILLSPILLKSKMKLWIFLITPISVLIYYFLRFKGYNIFFPYNVLFFWNGISFYYLGIHYEEISEKIKEKLNLKITLFCILIVNILETYYLFKVKSEFDMAISQFKISSLMLTFFLIVFIIKDKRFKNIFENGFLVILGDLSFGIYLIHALLIGIFSKVIEKFMSNRMVIFALVTLLVLVGSILVVSIGRKICGRKAKYLGF